MAELDQTEKKTYLEDFHDLISEERKCSTKHTVLIVDDEIDNLQLLKRTLKNDYKILSASNGDEAIEMVEKYGNEIALIISDQRMPAMKGTELFQQVVKKYPNIINMLLTGHSDMDTLVQSVNECNLFQYILKPFDPDELKVIVKNGIEVFELSNNKSALIQDLKELFYTTIKSISSALDAKDTYTHGHSQRVTLYSLMIAKEMKMDDEYMEEIETAGLLHDVGKIGVPDSILSKPGRLTKEEYEIMKTHPEQGKKMLNGINKLKAVSDWLSTHHERWDGNGYPNALKGENIPLTARIISIADTYDAMTSSRSYRKALDHEIAIEEIKNCSGTQFDPSISKVFLSIADLIKEAKEDPDEFYDKYSYLKKYFSKK